MESEIKTAEAEVKVEEDRALHEKVLEREREEKKVIAEMKLEQILKERRGKSLPISLDTIINCLITHNQRITKINRVQLPEGFYCKGVYYDPRSESFRFAIFSAEFDPVPKGMEFPLIEDISVKTLEVKQR